MEIKSSTTENAGRRPHPILNHKRMFFPCLLDRACFPFPHLPIMIVIPMRQLNSSVNPIKVDLSLCETLPKEKRLPSPMGPNGDMDGDLVAKARARLGVAPEAPKPRNVIPILDERAVMVAEAGAQNVIPFGGRSESPTRGCTGLGSARTHCWNRRLSNRS